ncbi:MAG: ABC transporter permease, partial [Nevskiales bacterium]|nr:ABC transporter permease [Nevskiales bacterium]
GLVGVLVALLAMSEGFQKTQSTTGRPDRVIVLREGSTDEMSSVMGLEQVQILRDLPGVRRGADGLPLAVGEMYVLTNVNKRDSTSPSNVVVRGTTAQAFKVRPEVRLIAGRLFEPGKREVVVGRGAVSEYAGLGLGQTVEVRDGLWTVVGQFESGGNVHESELWVDVTALHDAARSQHYTTLVLQLEDDRAETFTAFKDRVTQDPRVQVSAQREPDYYASRSEALDAFIRGLGYTVAAIMALGALFGALNTLYAAIAARRVEIATLRAIGFGGGPVVVSVLVEAWLLSLVGAVIGATIAYVVFNGFTVSTLNMQTFSQVAFAFAVTPSLLVQGIVWALGIGFFGGLFPALRAARMPVVNALRAT